MGWSRPPGVPPGLCLAQYCLTLMTMNKPMHSFACRPSERGVALIVVMVMLILGSILVLGSTRTTWFNETMVGNDSDYSRAYAAAEALVHDAEADIRGAPVGGQPFHAGDEANYPHQAARQTGRPFIPRITDDIDTVQALIPAANPGLCAEGICVPANALNAAPGLGDNWWTNPATLAAMTAVGATYGQFTGAVPANPNAATNAILTANPAQAWYWIEVFQYHQSPSEPRDMPIPDAKWPFVYRITAIAQGLKPNTQVVLRTIFVPRPKAS